MENSDTSLEIGVLDDGIVVIQFNKLIKQVNFTPEQAISLGVGLIQWGTRGESLQRVAPPAKTALGPKRVV